MGRFELTKLPARFGVSTLMLLVALSAVAVYAYMNVSEKRAKLERVRIRYVAKANVNRMVHRHYSNDLNRESDSAIRAWLSEQIRYHGDLEKKYRKAASAPWMVVEPDPPRPPNYPTDEQIAESVKSMTPAEIKAKFREVQLSRHKKPSYLPRKLSDLKSP